MSKPVDDSKKKEKGPAFPPDLESLELPDRDQACWPLIRMP